MNGLVEEKERLEKLAYEIKDFMEKRKLYENMRIYFNGKCLSASEGLIEGILGSSYFEYANDETISISFSGPFYRVTDDPRMEGATEILSEFDKLLESYGYYYELGHTWTLSLYKI